ncbi:hypothetical protein QA645_41065 [Bradyrhizobium sp. CIAT3101]|uniref:hypothetical protein n=1 Tax=Bradyrhizobium sp. CIAT3101 TaxID=439387 RepID=UPI0024B10A79|nr:hypothetical protein [Bradyrhizobium sp. CIAT3101]WFU80741.1 hypothetical protein QA645_41065 [Bradyrhizobium sp. CIAT3101]
MTPPASDPKKASAETPIVKVLNPESENARRIDMRLIGFKGAVSETALEQIEQTDARAQRVVTTATRFAFR